MREIAERFPGLVKDARRRSAGGSQGVIIRNRSVTNQIVPNLVPDVFVSGLDGGDPR